MASLSRIKILKASWEDSVNKYFTLTSNLDVLMNSKDKRHNEISLLIADIDQIKSYNRDLDAMISISMDLYTKQELKTFNDNQKVA